MKSASEHVQSPAHSLRIVSLVLCTIGACLSADLIRLHVRVHTDPSYHAYCAISEQVDCASVAQSPHVHLLSNGLPSSLALVRVPVSLFHNLPAPPGSDRHRRRG